MFPRLRQTISTTLVDRIDDLVEFSTLGEYVLADDGLPIATADAPACRGSRERGSRAAVTGRPSRDVCPVPDWAWPSSCDR
jgi:hypothetical protein